MQIVFVSGHHPADTPFAQVTRRLFQAYTQRHGYGFFYDDSPSPPDKQQQHHQWSLVEEFYFQDLKLFPKVVQSSSL
jgi:hypothetical protein